ncbi:ABC transporter substrate-binding protein [Streptomyces sp. WAC 01325]|uniref:ABC transporter substrate-binding protein n=1 Tax=Streptomyces sp. WAC 01325 TaxID=2203202 RepID=UPI000F896042|nr:ABC transporter substrate-binding protein [Streptomyces sp. WAC 01325]RSM88243.1 ABC transporter substrate-binding protein [Streptomyces sp. WAC 01325]
MNTRKQWQILLVLTVWTATTATGCGTGIAGWERDPIVIGTSDSVLSTDPASGYDPGSWMLFNNVFQSLLSFPEGGTQPQPEIAETCDFTDKAARVFRCVLKDGIKFSNGDPLTAEDVKFSFDRTLRIDAPAGSAVLFQSLGKVEAPDEKTIIFNLKFSDATFPSKIASGAGSIVSRHSYDPNALRADGQVVGSGPYKLESFSKDRAVFSVNEHYRGTATVKNSGVILRFFHGRETTLKSGLTEDGVDIAYRGLTARDLNDIDRRSARGSDGFDVFEGDSAEVQHLVFNMSDPVAGKLGVRRAIAYLLDREALVEQVYGRMAVPLYSIIPTGIFGHASTFFNRYGARPSTEKATAALLSEGIVEKVRLTLWSTPSRYGSSTDQELKVIAEQLNASGLFQADMRSVPFSQYEKDISKGRYGVYVKGWLPDYPDADNFTAPFFGHGNVLENNYVNRKITDVLIPRTAATSERIAVVKDFKELQSIVAEEVPVLPIWQGKQYVVHGPDVRGYEYCIDASTVFRFWNLAKK